MDDYITTKPPLIKLTSSVSNVFCNGSTNTPENERAMQYEVIENEVQGYQKAGVETPKDKTSENWMLETFASQNHPLELMVCVKSSLSTVILM